VRCAGDTEQRTYDTADEAHAFNQSDLFPTFTAEEMGRIAVAIIKGVDREDAIKALPRYTPQQHEAYAKFYDDLNAIIKAE
jgi:hypothetical protein